VFIAYFVMALPAGAIMKKYGYKAGILTGLSLFAIGSYLSHLQILNYMLFSYFLYL
jgi:FHS family L-fucose permease-like MFS transporter